GAATKPGAPLLSGIARSGDVAQAESRTPSTSDDDSFAHARTRTVEERPFRAASAAKKEGALAPADAPSPWSKRRDHKAHREDHAPLAGPIPLEELHAIAEESSQSERRADDAERELMEWKKVKFMQDRVGEDFDGLVTSVTKFGFL